MSPKTVLQSSYNLTMTMKIIILKYRTTSMLVFQKRRKRRADNNTECGETSGERKLSLV